ncbi:MAG: hypothetical protein C4291_07200 [Candidatus Dadabacteria bacterium]
MHRIAFVSLIIILFLPIRSALTQTMGGGAEVTSPTSQTPSQGNASQSGQFVNPPYFPQKDLNPFELSTLGGRNLGERKEGSTLGIGTKQKSNVEVNKPREKKESEESATQGGAESGTGANTTAAGAEETTQANPNESTEVPSNPLNKSSGLYTWKDKNGVVHVTNNIGSIPAEYQEQTINKTKNGKSKEGNETPQSGEQQ